MKKIFLACALAFITAGQIFAQQNWVRQNGGTVNKLNAVYFTDANTGTIAGDLGTILRTTNGGQTWFFQDDRTFDINLRDVFFTNINNGIIAGRTGTVLYTRNGGAFWGVHQVNGLFAELNGVHFIMDSVGIAVGSVGSVWRSTTGGRIWTILFSSLILDNLNEVAFGNNQNGLAVGGTGAVYRTNDGGVTRNSWTLSRITNNNLYGVSFGNPNTAWAVGQGGVIFRTTNAGISWSPQNSGVTVDLNDVFFLDVNLGVAVGQGGTIVRTINGGQTWTRDLSNTLIDLFGVHLSNPGTGTAVGGNGTILRTAPCIYAITPTNRSFSPAGGTGIVSVSASGGCSWTAVSNVPWITITAGNTGNGNGNVNYSVAANNTTTRTGTMTIAGQTFTVTQMPCSFSIAPTTRSIGPEGGAGSVAVTSNTGCTWTATSNVNWITITSGSSGTGNGTVNYNVAINNSSNARTGTLTIAGRTFTLTQNSCSFAIFPTSQSLGAAGGAGRVDVTTSSACSWISASNDNWITITSGSSGTGSGVVTFMASANTSSNSRAGTLTIAGQLFNVFQAGASATNRPPFVDNAIPNQSLVVGSSFVRDLSVVFSDPDGDPLNYSVNSSAPSVAETSLSLSTLTVSALTIGNATINLSASDGRGGSVQAGFSVNVISAPTTGCWTEDDFDNHSLGCLDSQNDWRTVPGRACAPVIPDPSGSGNVLELDPAPGATIIMSKIVNTQTSGMHELALRVMVEHQNTGAQSMAKIEVNTPNGTFWDKKFQLYFGESMRLNYSPTDEINFLANVVAGRWYEVRAIFDLAGNRLDLLVDGNQVMTNLPIGAGPITEIRINGFDYSGRVLLDDVSGCVSTFASSVNLIYNQVDAGRFPLICSYVTVNDGRGNPITGLDSTHFVVTENGQIQNPIKVTPVGSTNDPLTVGMVIDRSGSMSGQPLQDAKTAANIFVNQMAANDRAAVISFSNTVIVDQAFTSDKALLTQTINALIAGGGTAIYDALIEAVRQMDTQTGRKAILLLTDGEDVSSSATLQQAISAAVQSGVPVFTIGLGLTSGSLAEQSLQQIATSTSGRYYFAPNSSDLQEIYRLISQQLRSQYKITYTASNPRRYGGTRNVQITVNYQGLSATRNRIYLAPLDTPASAAIAPVVASPQQAGQEFWVEIMVGDSANPVSNLFGASFELNYSNTNYVEADTNVVPGAFLGKDLVFISNVHDASGKVSVGVSSKSGQSSVNGAGVLARIKFLTLPSTPANTQVMFTLSNLSAIDSARQAIPLTALADTITIDRDTDVDNRNAAPVTDYRLEQNYPNPFNPSTTIAFSLPVSGRVTLTIFNLLGEEVATLVNQERAAGRHSIRWNASNMQSGVYFYRLRAGDFVQTRKLTLAK